jgi:hypothetical protein
MCLDFGCSELGNLEFRPPILLFGYALRSEFRFGNGGQFQPTPARSHSLGIEVDRDLLALECDCDLLALEPVTPAIPDLERNVGGKVSPPRPPPSSPYPDSKCHAPKPGLVATIATYL